MNNGNFLLVEGSSCHIREVSPDGETAWVSTVPLLNPVSAAETKNMTFIISDYDNHRLIEIDHKNNVLNSLPGFNHPSQLQLLADGNLICADSDQRRVMLLSAANQLLPLITEINRPRCVAYSPEKGLLAVGIEPFFKPTAAEEIPITKGVRIQCIILWLESIVLLILTYILCRRLHPAWKNFTSRIGSAIPQYSCPMLITAVLCGVAGSHLVAHSHPLSGCVFLALTFIVAIIIRLSRPGNEWFFSDAVPNETLDAVFIRSPWLLLTGLSLTWFVVLWTTCWPTDWWPLGIWVAAPCFCIYAFNKRSKETSSFTDTAWLILILLIAVFFRTYRIWDIPYGLWLDETFSAYKALLGYETNALLPFQTTPLVRPGEFEIPNLYLVILVIYMKTIGGSFLFVKSTSIIPSLGIVLAVYCIGKWSFDVWVGRCSALLVAVISWQVTLARWGWLQQWYVCLALFAIAFYIRAYKWKCPRSAALSGLFLGFGLYTYIPIVLTIATIFTLYLLSFTENERWLRFKQLCTTIVMIIVVFGPLWAYYYYHPGIFSMRANSVSITEDIFKAGSLQPLKESLWKYLTVFHTPIEYNPRHSIPFKPLLDPITGGLALIGLGWILTRFYKARERMILLVFAVSLIGGIFSVAYEAPNTFRIGLTGPVICLWAGLPLAALLRYKRKEQNAEKGFLHNAIAAFVILIFLTITSLNYYRYFHVYPVSKIWDATFGAKQHLIYTQLTPDNLGTDRLYVHPEYSTETMRIYLYFLNVKKSGAREALITNAQFTPFDVKEKTPPLASGINTLIMPVDYENLLLEKFPGITLTVLKNPFGEPQAIMGQVTKP